MTRQEFESEMERLQSAFNRDHFKPARIAVFWKHVSDLPVTWFRKYVDKMIMEYRVVDLSEAAAAERKARNSYNSLRQLGDQPDIERGPERLKIIFGKMGVNSLDEAIKRGRK